MKETQRPLTVIVPVIPEKLDSLKNLLNEISNDIRNNRWIPFSDLSTTHFCRWVIIDQKPAYAPLLVFESNYDGSLEEYYDELFSKAGKGIAEIYRHCEGYKEQGKLKEYFNSHKVYCEAYATAYQGHSLKTVRNNSLIRQKITDFLSTHDLSRFSPADIHRKIVDFLNAEKKKHPDLQLYKHGPTRLGKNLKRFLLFLLLMAIGLMLLPVILVLLIILRIYELTEAVDPLEPYKADKALVEKEDIKVQNQLTHVVEIKQSLYRFSVLKSTLFAVKLLGRYHFTEGNFGGITSIHYARWVMIDNKRLVFFSNYDGSWENYLGDFIDKASLGLTSVWSNTIGFPRTFCLAWKGSRDEERFKQWTRKHQIPTQVWYSAHTSETVKNILNNIKIRNGIEGARSEKAIRKWLKRL